MGCGLVRHIILCTLASKHYTVNNNHKKSKIMRYGLIVGLTSIILGGCQTLDSGSKMNYPVSKSSVSISCLPVELKNTLKAIENRFGKVTVISTYRRNARIAGTRHASYHASCKAIDFHPARGSYGQVLAWLRLNHQGGLGTYSGRMQHLHIDNGPYIRFHHGSRRHR